MQSDELIWKTIAFQFCSFKIKTETQNFCKNEYNVSGLCSRQTCPLANSNYATIKCIDNQLYLFVKTIERAHTPSKMWEKIKLKNNYKLALEQIDTELEHWSEALIHKIKQRLTKLTQSLIRTRRLILKTQPELIGIKKKIVRRESKRELKALTAARLETTIEKELLERLRKGVYGDGILNESQEAFTKALDALGQEQDVQSDIEQEVEFEEEQDDDFDQDDDDLDREFVSDFDSSSEDDEDDVNENHFTQNDSDDSDDSSDFDSHSDSDNNLNDKQKSKVQKKKAQKKKGAYVKVEYEMETEKQMGQGHETFDW